MKNNIRINQNIDPNWITGFTDAEGSFRLVLIYDKIEKWKYTKRANFTISQKSTSNRCLYLIKDYFKCGNVYNKSNGISTYEVNKLSDLNNKIMPHFNKYPLLTSKKINFNLWIKGIEILNKKDYKNKTMNELLEIINKMNKKITFEIKWKFLNLNIVNKINPNWITGFTDGDGCFYFKLSKTILASYELTQNTHDYLLLNSIKNYFKTGNISPNLKNIYCMKNALNNKSISRYYINTKEGINKVINHFNKYPLLTNKKISFEYWKILIDMKNNNKHKIKDSLNEMIDIKNKMNPDKKN